MTFLHKYLFQVQGVQEFCASILYLVVLCQFLISDAWQDSFEKPRARRLPMDAFCHTTQVYLETS
jgi:hypothetical protein